MTNKEKYWLVKEAVPRIKPKVRPKLKPRAVAPPPIPKSFKHPESSAIVRPVPNVRRSVPKVGQMPKKPLSLGNVSKEQPVNPWYNEAKRLNPSGMRKFFSTYDDYLKDPKAAMRGPMLGKSYGNVATGVMSRKHFGEWQKDFANTYVEGPARKTFLKLVDEGHTPTSSNAFGPGSFPNVTYLDKVTGKELVRKLSPADFKGYE